MRRPRLWQAAALGALVLVLLLAVIFFLPRLAYPGLSEHALNAVGDANQRLESQNARFRLQGDFRGQLLQALAGLVVAAGAIGAWQQVRVAREAQITERFSRAVEHLGSDKLHVRVGAIYELERLANNSPADRPSVTSILRAFVRERAPWPVGSPDGPEHPTPTVEASMPWLQTRAADLQAALKVLGRFPQAKEQADVYLSYVDLRVAHLAGAQLANSHLRHSNLARAWMKNIDLRNCDLDDTDLRQAVLIGAHLRGARLRGTHLQGADLRAADLRGADLTGADLSGADLTEARLDDAQLTNVIADHTTTWPANAGGATQQLKRLAAQQAVAAETTPAPPLPPTHEPDRATRD